MLLTAAVTLLLLWTIKRGVPQAAFRSMRSSIRGVMARS
jgi:hypothetical protein